MSKRYPGFPAVAKRYWQAFLMVSLGGGALLVFTGAIAALIVLVFLPEAVWFFVLAAVSLVLHAAALFIRDVQNDEYEPEQTTFSSPILLFAFVVLVGVLLTTLLLVATAGAYIASEIFEAPVLVAAGIAAYYPVVDVALGRRGWWTPATIAFVCTLVVVSTIFDIHRSIIEALPVFGRGRHPQ